MSLDADFIVDRRRMRRKLPFWRVFAVLFAICAIVAGGSAATLGDILGTALKRASEKSNEK
jgi:protease-4